MLSFRQYLRENGFDAVYLREPTVDINVESRSYSQMTWTDRVEQLARAGVPRHVVQWVANANPKWWTIRIPARYKDTAARALAH